MKKLAIVAVVLLTTSCAVSEESQFERSSGQSPDSVQSQNGSNNDVKQDNQAEDNSDSQTEPKSSSPSTEGTETTDSQIGTPESAEDNQTDSAQSPEGDETDSSSTSSPNETESDSEENAETVDSDPRSEETVNSYIDLLRVAPEVTSGYDRDLFRHWVDADGDGCHAREETLIAESVGRASVSGDCDISGSWFSAFDGETTTNPSNFDVDHLVPLKEAWDSGANRWDSDTRERFANDLGSPHSLIAVSRGSNRSKGAKDPAEWMPPRTSYHCEYIFTWTLVKIRWSLAADPAEIRALRNLGGDCLVSEMNFEPTVSEAEIIAGNPPAPAPAPEPEPEPSPNQEQAQLDPRFRTCGLAKENGYGPYVEGVDPEYEWYRDGDGDGTVCE